MPLLPFYVIMKPRQTGSVHSNERPNEYFVRNCWSCRKLKIILSNFHARGQPSLTTTLLGRIVRHRENRNWFFIAVFVFFLLNFFFWRGGIAVNFAPCETIWTVFIDQHCPIQGQLSNVGPSQWLSTLHCWWFSFQIHVKYLFGIQTSCVIAIWWKLYFRQDCKSTVIIFFITGQ